MISSVMMATLDAKLLVVSELVMPVPPPPPTLSIKAWLSAGEGGGVNPPTGVHTPLRQRPPQDVGTANCKQLHGVSSATTMVVQPDAHVSAGAYTMHPGISAGQPASVPMHSPVAVHVWLVKQVPCSVDGNPQEVPSGCKGYTHPPCSGMHVPVV
jgi:hypothetical protein